MAREATAQCEASTERGARVEEGAREADRLSPPSLPSGLAVLQAERITQSACPA